LLNSYTHWDFEVAIFAKVNWTVSDYDWPEILVFIFIGIVAGIVGNVQQQMKCIECIYFLIKFQFTLDRGILYKSSDAHYQIEQEPSIIQCNKTKVSFVLFKSNRKMFFLHSKTKSL
jgi:hypothetical protein